MFRVLPYFSLFFHVTTWKMSKHHMQIFQETLQVRARRLHLHDVEMEIDRNRRCWNRNSTDSVHLTDETHTAAQLSASLSRPAPTLCQYKNICTQL